ncbi:hypothetical protein ASG75_02730 [Rhodanobacter sp. Soil772]|nr:hypothetical protein ASG75_02730 [Rhodanobacter sp. Soil772]
MNLVVSIALRIKRGEEFEEFAEDLDVKAVQRMKSQGWLVYLEQQRKLIVEEGVDWLLTLPEVSGCPQCQHTIPTSDTTVCPKCSGCISFPSMQRAIIAADRLVGLIEDFILLDPTDRAKQMLSSLINMRDNAFFYQAIPSPESLMVFRNYWDGQVDLWDWDLEYTFRLRDGQFISAENKGVPSTVKDAKAKQFAGELFLFKHWLFHETAVT